MRRLPIYILVDTSGSMLGEPIEAVNNALGDLNAALKRDPEALETVWVAVHTFDRSAKVVMPLSPIETSSIPKLTVENPSPTNLGEGLMLLCSSIQSDLIKSSHEVKGDYLPLVFVMTDGSPSDTMQFEQSIGLVSALSTAHIIGCAAGAKAKVEPLKRFCSQVFSLDVMDQSAFSNFFNYVTVVIKQGSRSIGSQANQLPSPPATINLVS
jgi:uncharacterized protein YegL